MRNTNWVYVILSLVSCTFCIASCSMCNWDVMHCDREEIFCKPEESILLDSKRSLPRKHCFAIKDRDEGRHQNYEIGVDLLSLESKEGLNTGYLGIIFNYHDPMNYDYIYLENHNTVPPQPPKTVTSPPSFMTGYRLDGEYFLDERVFINKTVLGTTFHSLRLVIDNNSSLSTKVYLDKQFIGSFQEHFAPRLKGGVFIVNEFGTVALFKNFYLKECNEFNEFGQCDRKCPDNKLSDLSRGTDLRSNGWVITCTSENVKLDAHCGSDTWYGWIQDKPIGYISAELQGTGQASLSFGSCAGGPGFVRVLLNGNIIEQTARGQNERKDVTFNYSAGDLLKIEEIEIQVIKMYSISFDCY